MAVLANLVVKFGDDADSDAHTSFELDDFLNDGASSFKPNDTINLLIQYDKTVLRLTKVVSTSGQLVPGVEVVRDVSDIHLWTDEEDAHDLSSIPYGTLTKLYFGNEASIYRVGSMGLKSTSYSYPAYVELSYRASFLSYRLIAPDVVMVDEDSLSPGYTKFPITVIAYFDAL